MCWRAACYASWSAIPKRHVKDAAQGVRLALLLCVHALILFLPSCSVFDLLYHRHLETFLWRAETPLRASKLGWLIYWLRLSKMFIAGVDAASSMGLWGGLTVYQSALHAAH